MAAKSATGTAACVVCKEDIRAGARVCTHCKSAQDWTRYLSRWSAIAAAIVGLGSLVTVAYSLWKLVPSPARIEPVVLSCERDRVTLALFNVGGRPGAVEKVALKVASGGRATPPVDLSPQAADERVLIESGKSATVTYVHRVGSAPALFNYQNPCRFTISVAAVDFQGKRDPSTRECECPP